jgi:hypothetical protein
MCSVSDSIYLNICSLYQAIVVIPLQKDEEKSR